MATPAAGATTKNSNRRGGKKPLGANVDSFLKREDQIDKAGEHVKRLQYSANNVAWAEKRYRNGLRANIERQNKAVANELEMASVELKVRRKERLRELYQDMNERYEEELNARGLAFVRQRD